VSVRVAVLRLTLAQFRSHALTEIATEGRSVALVGPNGAGKTNLLEAVSLLSPGRGLRRAEAGELARAPGALGWRVRATLAGPGGGTEAALSAEPGAPRRVEIDGKAASQTALGAMVPLLWLTPAMDRLWIEGAEGRRRFLDRAALAFFPRHGEVAARYDRAMRERNRLLRDGPAEPAWLDALEARMAAEGVALARARAAAAARLTAAQDGAKTLFPLARIAIVGRLEERIAGAGDPIAPPGDATDSRDAEIMEEFRAALARGRRDDAAAGRAGDGPHRSDLDARHAAKDLPARLCSTGEQKALLVSLTLATARGLADARGAAPLLLLDEATAHLDAARRAALFEEIDALGSQVWMTGTDEALPAGPGRGALRLRVRERDGASEVRADD
jgi:DNA replication and repair protein RecF